MAHKNKAIYVHNDVFKLISEAKTHFEGLTGTRTTWSAYLYALASGALVISSLAGLNLRCPDCGHKSELYYTIEKGKGKQA